MPVDTQPEPIIITIFNFLDYNTHFKLRSVCYKFKKIIDSMFNTEPRNILECVITDNVYCMKNYIEILDKPMMTAVHELYLNNFLEMTYRKFIYKFCSRYLCEINIYEHLSKATKNIEISDIMPFDDKDIEFLIEYIVSTDDLINLKKIDELNNNDFLNSYQKIIMKYAMIYGCVHIIKYMTEKYRQYVIPNIHHFILAAGSYNNILVVQYFMKNFYDDVDIKCLINISITKNNICVLNYIELQCLKFSSPIMKFYTNAKIGQIFDDVSFLNLDVIKFYVNNYSQTLIFMTNMWLIFCYRMTVGDVKSIDYILTKVPDLVYHFGPVQIYKKDHVMIDILVKHQVLNYYAGCMYKIIGWFE